MGVSRGKRGGGGSDVARRYDRLSGDVRRDGVWREIVARRSEHGA